MITLPHIRRSLLLVALGGLAACSSHRIAGSMTLSNHQPSMLRVRAADAADLWVQVWNRGPGDVTFERVRPAGGSTGKGTLLADGPEFTWQATTKHFELLLTTTAEEATVAYTLRSDQSAEMYVGKQPDQ